MGRLAWFLAALFTVAFTPVLAAAQTPAPPAPAAAPLTVEPYRPDDRTLGSATAPVTLTAYISTTCSHCAHWHVVDLPAFKTKYIDTGLVRLVYRDLPTSPVRIAMVGTAIARCAPAERYEAVLDALYRGQARFFPEWEANGWLVAGGEAGGLTPETMNACITPESMAEVEARVDRSMAEGIAGTPTFFVNGRQVLQDSRTFDVAAFDAVIQPLLAGR
ncbi:MAG: DsbA family protein [Brevundimonas sp.]|nr:MAG: DsbA family protein [Brevundimonas sp.]